MASDLIYINYCVIVCRDVKENVLSDFASKIHHFSFIKNWLQQYSIHSHEDGNPGNSIKSFGV